MPSLTSSRTFDSAEPSTAPGRPSTVAKGADGVAATLCLVAAGPALATSVTLIGMRSPASSSTAAPVSARSSTTRISSV